MYYRLKKQFIRTFFCFFQILIFTSFLIGQNRTKAPLPLAETQGLELVFGGDVMLDGRGGGIIAHNGADFAFDSTRAILTRSDIACVNLEAPFTLRGIPHDKKYTFRVHPEYAKALVNAGIGLCTLANNHILDYGEVGLYDTFAVLDSNGIAYCGAGSTRQDAMKGVVITRKGIRVGFLAFSLTYPDAFWASDSKAGTLYPTDTILKRCIQNLQSQSDYVVVTFHWGQELMTAPKGYQKRYAREAIQLGADVVIGHHPHVPQGIEVYQNRIIAYSLGNYVFGSYSNKVKNGLLVKVVLKQNKIKTVEVIPIAINNHDVQMQPKVLKGFQKKECIDELNRISSSLNRNNPIIQPNGIVIMNESL